MRRLLLPLALAAAVAAGHAQAQSFSSLEERMTESEFKAAGLDKLSEEELAALNAWLAREVGETAASALAEDRRGFPADRYEPDLIRSYVPGEFRGWSRKGELITLANGQVWEVLEVSSRLSVKLTDPAVTITRGVLGAWYFKVDGYNARASVKRVK
ncbi:hypothetical protein [Arenimonas fontis]|uniref:Secreted protein n=1 Tax=Arenimonas fontis TaxID=2608255 RepID=A0A5B2ZAB9_9GAMM|nr:hypothetical protein [Arenimonas fontis]KAA2284887.1 hypothetical protein F0415_06425 [Arenimonas fontis]